MSVPLLALPVTTIRGDGGWLVFRIIDGSLIALISRQPGPMISLKSIIGPHVLASVMLTVTSQEWIRLVARVPGGEGLADR